MLRLSLCVLALCPILIGCDRPPVERSDASAKPATGHVYKLSSAGFSAGGRVLVTVDSAGMLILWDARTGSQLRQISSQESWFEFSPSRESILFLAKGQDSAKLVHFDLKRRESIFEVPLEKGYSTSQIQFTADQQSIALNWKTHRDRVLVNSKTGSEVRAEDPETVLATDREIPSYNRFFNSASEAAELAALLIESGKEDSGGIKIASHFCIPPEGWAVLPGGKHLLTSNWLDTGSETVDVAIWKPGLLEPIHSYRSTWGRPPIYFLEDGGDRYVTGVGTKNFEIRSLTDQNLRRSEVTVESKITAFAYSPTRKTLAIGMQNGQLSFWSVEDEDWIVSLNMKGPIRALASSPGYIFSASEQLVAIDLDDFSERWKVEERAFKLTIDESGSRLLAETNLASSLFAAETGKSLNTLQRTPSVDLRLSPSLDVAFSLPRRPSMEGIANRSIAWDARTGVAIADFPPQAWDYEYPWPSMSTVREIVYSGPASSVGLGSLSLRRRTSIPVKLKSDWPLPAALLEHSSKSADWMRQQLQLNPDTKPLDGVQLMRREADGSLKRTIWNTQAYNRVLVEYRDGEPAYEYRLDDLVPTAATISADQQTLFVAFSNLDPDHASPQLAIFDRASGKLLQRIDATHEELADAWGISSLKIGPSEDYLLCGYEYHIYLFNRTRSRFLKIGSCSGDLPGRKLADFSPRGDRAVIYCKDRLLCDLQSGRKLANLGAYNQAGDFHFSPNGNFLLYHADNQMLLREASSGQLIRDFGTAELMFNPRGTHFASKDWRSSGELWSFQLGTKLVDSSESSRTIDMFFHPDNKQLVRIENTGKGPRLACYSLQDGSLIKAMDLVNQDFSTPIFGEPLQIINDDSFITRDYQSVFVWDLEKLELVHRLQVNSEGQCRMLLLKEEGALLLASPGGDAHLWSTATGKLLQSCADVPNDLGRGDQCLSVSSDGKHIIASYRNRQSLRTWELATGKVVANHHLLNDEETLRVEHAGTQ